MLKQICSSYPLILLVIIIFLLTGQVTKGQDLVVEGALFIGTFGVNEGEKVKYSIKSEKIIWVNIHDSTYKISSNSSLVQSSLETIGNSNAHHPSYWDCWFFAGSNYSPQITYGFYKLTNSKDPNLYFYLDTRDCRWGGGLSNQYNVDIYIKFNFESNKLSVSGTGETWTDFQSGSILKVWEIKKQGLPVTKYFEPPEVAEFEIDKYEGHPILIWNCESFYTSFLIERKVSNNDWVQIALLTENYYVDQDITWSGGTYSTSISYRIWTLNDNLVSTNSSQIRTILIDPEKQKITTSSSNQWLFISFDTTSSKDQVVYNISIDKNKNVWLTYSLYNSYLALVKYDGNEWKSWNVSKIFNIYPQNHFVATVDNIGIVWLYIYGGGLISFDGNIFQQHQQFVNEIIKYPKIAIDKDKNKWIFGPVGRGLVKVDSSYNSILYTTSNSPLPSNNGGLIYSDGDSIWICTYKGMVLLYNNNWNIFDTTNTKMPSQEIFSFAKDLKGFRWLGTRTKGLLKWINDSTFFIYNTSNAPFRSNFVNVITIDTFNNLWIGTDDGALKFDGNTFTYLDSTVGRSILDIKIDRFNNKWISMDRNFNGAPGLLIYNENGVTGINMPTGVRDDIPLIKQFTLFQNYPNPFNSKTIIKFRIPDYNFTILKVYDLLGREIATLLNEPKSSGEYEIEFNADKYNLTSGIYIYQLKSGSFVQLKKLVFMK